MKKSISFLLTLVMLIGLLPQFTLPARAEETEAATNGLVGKTISILGDSISTYTGVSNNAAYNATLSGGACHYTEGRWGVYQKDTWWQQAIDTLGLELIVNNSWSGSCIFNTRSGTVGAYVDRSVQLHNTKGKEPDMIAVYLGTNDFCNYKSTLGTSADIDYVSLITETEDGYTYATPTTAAEAYAIMLHKATVRYPDSEIYCFTLLPQRISNTDVKLLEQFNQTLLEIAKHFGAYGVDLYHNSGIKNDDYFATFVADNSLHPGPAGMDAITGCFISSILENSKYVATDVHSITYDLDNVIVDQGTAYAIMDGDTFSCTLTAPAGYDLSVSVTMGSTDITASSYANGKITISSVTADIAIAASAALPVKEAEKYRWEFNGSDLVSVTIGNNTPNALTRLAGSMKDGVHTGSRFQMSKNVVLYHDRPWTIEWKSAGTWTDTTDGALLFAGATTSSTADTPYIYRRHNSDFIAIGVYTGGWYHNYGVALRTSGIDATIDHVYRMENRVAADSTNMVYLYVDGVEIGPMNHHWIGGTDQNETIDWVNGRDFVFSYMGTTPHTIGNCSINYIQVIECVHTYQNSTCTAPTCTEQGYTTHICNRCNHSYVDTYVDALGHKTELRNAKEATCTEAGYTGDEVCTVCGETVKRGEAIPALGHSFGEWIVTAAPTCTAKGEETRTCTVCGGTETREAEALGHSYESTVTAPTCTEQGYTTYTCKCGDSYVDDYVDATGEHTYENGICTGCGDTTPFDAPSDIDLFVFAGQSNMMGAAVLEPEVDTFTDKALEYKYMPKLRGAENGSFVPAQNPAGEFHYKDLTAAYGDKLNDLSYQSTLTNYSANTYFCPAMRNDTKGFAAQSEADTYPGASLPPYFVTEYADYGHSSVYAHMAKGSVKITHYFTEEMMTRYNALITQYNAQNGSSYPALTRSNLSGAGDAFDGEYTAMLVDYADFTPHTTVENKCFVWLQGEGDAGGSYIEYKLKMQVLWEHLQELGFTHFFVLRVGYWGNAGIRNVIKAQEDFCAENDNCCIVTRAPSLVPYPGATTDNWWISEPSAEYDDCRDSYVVNSGNHHFNEKAMQIFAERSAKNVHRVLHLGLEPVLEEENIQGLLTEQPDKDETPYTSYVGTEVFRNSLSVSKPSDTWKEQVQSSAGSTDLIAVKSTDSVWLQYVFFKNEAHAVGGFYDAAGNLVAPLYYKQFGFTLDGNTSGVSAFQTPKATNRVSIAAVEAATGREIAFVRFTAWKASAGGHANTEARIYHEEEIHTHSYTSLVTAPTCTEQGYTTHTCSRCNDSYVDTYVDALGHNFGDWQQTKAPTCTAKGEETRTCTACDGKETREVDALGHDYKAVVTAPTCTEQGYTTHTCSRCADSYVDTYVDALGHNFGDWQQTKAPTCTAKGEETRTCTVCGGTETREVAALGHSYESTVTAPTCTEKGYTTHTCTRCGDSHVDAYVDALGHKTELKNAKEATCTEAGYTGDEVCTVCGETVKRGKVIPALGHSFGAWIVTTAPTCTAKGEETRTCTVCGGTETGAVAALGHSYESVVTAPTCTEKGYTTHNCTRCGDGYVDTYVDALGHSFGNWSVTTKPTCTETGVETHTCSVCGAAETRPVDALGHDYKAVVTAPTCTERGYTTHTCSRCNDSYVDTYVDALGHKTELKNAKEATCTEVGYTGDEICTVCGETLKQGEEIPALSHSFGKWIVTSEPACTEEGKETRTCTICGETETREVEALGHVYTNVVTAPTCTEQGYTTHTCTRCGDSYVDAYVDALGHDYSAGVCTVCAEDTVTASLDRNVLALTGELAEGTRILAACYDIDGQFTNAKIFIWQGNPIAEEIPMGEKVKLFFVDENWPPLRKFIPLR